MNLTIIHAGEFTKVLDEPLRALGHKVNAGGDPDAVILMSISQMDKVGKIPVNIPLFVYDWDLYPGLIEQKTYNWDGFAEIKRHAKEVWVPSKEVAKRNKELYDIESVVVRSFARLFEAKTTRGDYVFNGMREYGWDAQNGWLRQACGELGIPLLQPDHQLSEEKYREAVAGCRVAVCEFEEASTGGLTLIEAHALGKPVIFGDSEYMGAKDYFGWRGFRYKTGDFEDFKKVLKNVYHHEPGHDKKACWDWAQSFTPERMALAMHERLTI